MYRAVLMLAFSAAISSHVCQNTTCPRFYNAECRDDHCVNATCTPHFFFRGANVSSRCQVETCAEKNCSKNRRCIEEVTTLSCPAGRTDCRQILRSRCVLMETNRPMSCGDIQCDLGEVCRFRARTGRHPVVRCVSMKKQRSCTNIHCSNGHKCVEEKSKIRCIEDSGTAEPVTLTSPQSSETTPTSSLGSGMREPPGSGSGDELCDDGTVCYSGERCTTIPSSNHTACIPVHVNASCDQLSCPSEAPICSLATHPSLNNCTAATCISQDKLDAYMESRKGYGGSCNFLSVRRKCFMNGLSCADLYQNHYVQVGTDCTLFNCQENLCSRGQKCAIIANTQAAKQLETDSLCIPSDADMTFDASCEDLEDLDCAQGGTCTEYWIGDTLVGSFCDRGVVPQLPCAERTCLAEREVCSEHSFGSVQLHSLCTHEDEIFQIFSQLGQESCWNSTSNSNSDMMT